MYVCVQAALEKETQLRQELEERLSKESSLTDRLSKEVAAAKVLMCVYDAIVAAAAPLILYTSANDCRRRALCFGVTCLAVCSQSVLPLPCNSTSVSVMSL